MHRLTSLLTVGLLLILLTAACSDDAQTEGSATPDGAGDPAGGASPAAGYSWEAQPQGASVTFATPEAAATVASPLEVAFEVQGVELAPAGAPAVGRGHLHVVVDNGCYEPGTTIPGPGRRAEEQGVHHFADGARQGRLSLEPGGHALCVQLGDGAHTAFGQTDEILVTVE